MISHLRQTTLSGLLISWHGLLLPTASRKALVLFQGKAPILLVWSVFLDQLLVSTIRLIFSTNCACPASWPHSARFAEPFLPLLLSFQKFLMMKIVMEISYQLENSEFTPQPSAAEFDVGSAKAMCNNFSKIVIYEGMVLFRY